jgi:mono/diheme cytochrome c family protein
MMALQSRRTPRARALAVAVAVPAAAGIAWAVVDASGKGEAARADGALVALGEAVYAQHCAACHGADLDGQPNWRQRRPDGRLPAPPHDDSGHTWHHDDETLFIVTKFGAAKLIGGPVETDMPRFEGVLSDREIRAVLAFIRSRWSEEVRRQNAALNERTRGGRS